MGSGWERAPLASESYKKEPADHLRSVNTMQATVGHELDVLYEKIHQQVSSQVRTIHRLMMAPATEVVQKVAPVIPVACQHSVVLSWPRSCKLRCICDVCKHRNRILSQGPEFARCQAGCQFCSSVDQFARQLLDKEMQEMQKCMHLILKDKPEFDAEIASNEEDESLVEKPKLSKSAKRRIRDRRSHKSDC